MRDVSRYVVDGQRVLSVTEALSLSGWVRWDGVPWEVLDAAARRGTWVHEATVLMDEDDLDWDTVPEEWSGYLDAYRLFRMEADFVISHREAPLVHPVYRFAGTTDIAGTLNGQDAVIDIKTGDSRLFWPLQLSGYSLLLGGNGRKRFSLRLRANGDYRLDSHDDPKDGRLFLAALETAQAMIARGAAAIPEPIRD